MAQLISLDIYQMLCVGAIALAVGLFLVSKSKNLRKFCIPAAVVGGLVVTLIVTLVHKGGIAEITFDSTLKDVS